MSWKIPAAAKVSVCRHSLAWSQDCLSLASSLQPIPEAGFAQGPSKAPQGCSGCMGPGAAGAINSGVWETI